MTFQGEYQRARSRDSWNTHEIATKHDAMVESPDVLAALLDKIAAGKG